MFIAESIQIQDSPIVAHAWNVLVLLIGKAFGVRMGTLMRMQSAYEIAQTRKREKLIRVQRVVRGVSFDSRSYGAANEAWGAGGEISRSQGEIWVLVLA
ncbi:MAG: hypothetical protein ABR956_04965 [Terracidiphilus sp.]